VKRALLLALGLAACSSTSPSDPAKASAEPPAPSAPAPPVSASASAPAPALTLAPPEGAASREDREKAALQLLSGKARAADLPLADVERGEEFDHGLREALQLRMDVHLGDVTVRDLDKQAVTKAVEPQIRRFRRCYASELRFNPNLQGQIRARIAVKAAGTPSRVEHRGSDLPDLGVLKCVLGIFEKIELPAPQGPEGEAIVPVIFSPLD
jgi:hypothetical protein